MMQPPTLTIGNDGFYHPSNEIELIALVKKAAFENLEVRCRGAAHSMSRAIYTDAGLASQAIKNIVSMQVPPMGPNLNIMLDNYNRLVWIDEEKGIIEVEAGIHLGFDPEDPTGSSTLENSLLFQAFKKGFTLSDLGGISHQTVSGFLMTGSAGGSLQYSIDENIEAISMIDGNGELENFTKDHEYFNAIILSLGLLGVVSKVRLKLTPNFNICGKQSTYLTNQQTVQDSKNSKIPIDLFGCGTVERPGLENFLLSTPYARILWWPQLKVTKMVIWEAARVTPIIDFTPLPYEQFDKDKLLTYIEQLAASMLFTILGNNKFFNVWEKLRPSFVEFKKAINKLWGDNLLSKFTAEIITFVLKVIFFVISYLFTNFKWLAKLLYAPIINLLQPIKNGSNAQLFRDYAYSGLPMDNEANDIMLGTEFTEIWIPLSNTSAAMKLLDKMFTEGKYSSTGYYSTELYAGKKSRNWLSPAYNTDVFRIDFFWFTTNDCNPAISDGFFDQFWKALKKEGIPFRLHWAKYLPEYDYEDWSSYFRKQYPKWDDFMNLRKKRDPNNIFLTNYWSLHLFGKSKYPKEGDNQKLNYPHHSSLSVD